ncbi:GUN4 domain-containing protein [Sphaerospermopsis kisseleviana]|uniref:GUN4 domain-containing protein n=1 Tax=Sphaerospermopsis kisseleviana TaxID=289435 RepID=UPI000B5FE3E5|nr:serine/threonine kinase [Sphaerospermopsis kisseleviana NIES-73]
MNNPQQPREYDAVLGGNSPSLEGAAVLGGIEGVKLRLQNPDANVRIAALEQALNYGEQGLDLVIKSLKDEAVEVQDAAYLLLKFWKEENKSSEPSLLEKIRKFVFKHPNHQNIEQILISKVNQALRKSDAHLKLGCSTDYTHLRDLLAVGKWEEADKETRRVMLAVAKREGEGWLNIDSINKFPCEDLRTIDKLWVKYSNGKFGFSVQQRIYQSLGGTKHWTISEALAFCDKVGWKKNRSVSSRYSDILPSFHPDSWDDYYYLSFPEQVELYRMTHSQEFANKEAPKGLLPWSVHHEIVGMDMEDIPWGLVKGCEGKVYLKHRQGSGLEDVLTYSEIQNLYSYSYRDRTRTRGLADSMYGLAYSEIKNLRLSLPLTSLTLRSMDLFTRIQM